MDIRQLTPTFYVAPQIAPEDLPKIAASGIKRIICNRPDIEVPSSHQASAMRTAALAAGLDFVERPLTHQTMTPDIIAENYALIEDSDGAVLAYCASGTRSTIAWALAAAQDLAVNDIIAAARACGYDLEGLRPALEAAKS